MALIDDVAGRPTGRHGSAQGLGHREQLVGGERTVTELENLTAIHQPTLSQQLGVLRNEGLVDTRRDGKWMYYRVAREEVLILLDALHGIYCKTAPGPGPAA